VGHSEESGEAAGEFLGESQSVVDGPLSCVVQDKGRTRLAWNHSQFLPVLFVYACMENAHVQGDHIPYFRFADGSR